jgi:hypothetical protein
MSEELPIVMVLSVMPVWFLKPSQDPAFTPMPPPPALALPGFPPDPLVPAVPAVPSVPPVVPVPVVAASVGVPVSVVPVPASVVPVPVVSEPLPDTPSTSRLASSAAFGSIADPPQAAVTNNAKVTRHTTISLLRTAELLTPVVTRANGTHIT